MVHYDAIIAGYGPTGATLANLLGQRGWRIAVLDKATEIYDKPRAITADHEAMRVFQSFGLADEIDRDTIPHPGTNFIGLDGSIIKKYYPEPGANLLGWKPSFMFFQPDLERTLRDGVDRFSNIDVRLGYEVCSFEQGEDEVRVTVQAPDLTTETLSGKYLLACDGARSVVRRTLQPSIEDLGFDEWWVVVDTQLLGDTDLPERVVQYCQPERPGTYIVGPGTLRRWELKILPGEDPADFHDESAIKAILSRFVDTDQIRIDRIAVYRFHALVVGEWRKNRVFLLGDAAHQMPPFLGQGMCAGIRDAVNLAWKLDAVERQGFSDTLLDSYGVERKRHVREVVGLAESFGRIIGELDPEICAERDQRLKAELQRGEIISRQSSIPGLTEGLIDQDQQNPLRIHAGKLFPQPVVRQMNGELAMLDDLLSPGFVIVLNDLFEGELSSEMLAICEQLDAQVVRAHGPGETGNSRAKNSALHVVDSQELLTGWMSSLEASAVVVRPDRYVYGVTDSATGLQELLGNLTFSVIGESAPICASQV